MYCMTHFSMRHLMKKTFFHVDDVEWGYMSIMPMRL